MGSSWSTLLVSKSDTSLDIVDEATGLTKREKNGIRSTWDIVKRDLPNNGVALFVMFFERNPTYQKKFSSFADLPLNELPKNKKVLAHATSVMYAVSSMVDSLDDAECLQELVTKIAQNHLRRDVTDKHFIDLGDVLIVFLEEKLGSKLTNQAKEAWKKLYSVVVAIVKEVQESNNKSQ